MRGSAFKDINEGQISTQHVCGCRDGGFPDRFSARYREYEYFIPCGDKLDLAAMQAAANAFWARTTSGISARWTRSMSTTLSGPSWTSG